MKIFLVVAASMLAYGCKSTAGSRAQSVEDVVSMNRNDDGTFRVICLDATNGSTYTEPNVMPTQIRANDVCTRNQASSQYAVEFHNNDACGSLVAIGRFAADPTANDAICDAQTTNLYVRSVKFGGACHKLMYNDTSFKAACGLVQPFNEATVAYFNDAACTGKLVGAYSFPDTIQGGQAVCDKAEAAMSQWGNQPYVRAIKQAGVCRPLVYNNLTMDAACKMAQVRRGANVVSFYNAADCKNLVGMVDVSSPAAANYGADRCADLANVANGWSNDPYIKSVYVDGACRALADLETIEPVCPRYALTTGGIGGGGGTGGGTATTRCSCTGSTLRCSNFANGQEQPFFDSVDLPNANTCRDMADLAKKRQRFCVGKSLYFADGSQRRLQKLQELASGGYCLLNAYNETLGANVQMPPLRCAGANSNGTGSYASEGGCNTNGTGCWFPGGGCQTNGTGCWLPNGSCASNGAGCKFEGQTIASEPFTCVQN